MTDKIRKRLGPVSVVATIAVLGLLAAFIALAALPETASAQPPAPPELPGAGHHADADRRVVVARRRLRSCRRRQSKIRKLAASRKPT